MKITHHNTDPSNPLAVVTRAKDDYDLAPLTQPLLDAYAERCGADFIVINEERIKAGDYSYEILQCQELFDTYERILSLDSDMIVTPECPDLFKLVPQDCVGTVCEDKYARRNDRRGWMRKAQEAWGDIQWTRGYINTGVFLCSRMHREIFDRKGRPLWMDFGFDDVFLGYRIREQGFKVFELPYEFNHMSMFSEIGSNWLKSHIIHYAGRGFYRRMTRVQQIQRDLQTLRNSSNKFLLNFANIPARIRLFLLGGYNLYRDRIFP